jgi:hypothetical protein
VPNRRFSPRKKCRYLIEWQFDESVHIGFTHDVSATGIFVRSTYIPGIGVAVTMQLLIPKVGKLRLRGTVVRSHRVPQNLRRLVPSGFCVHLSEAPEEYFQVLATLFSLRFAADATSGSHPPRAAASFTK